MSDLHLHLFGPPRVERVGVSLRFDTRKAVALLAYLAVTGRGHGRDAVAALLWPSLERTRARATLRRTLSVLAPVGPALVTDGGAIRLDPGAIWCDVTTFTSLAASGSTEAWRRAADLAGDTFLAGFGLRDSPAFEDWQLATADALTDRLSGVLGRLVADAVSRGDLAAALADARRRVEADPLSEPAHADLIRVAAWSGDRPAALRHYRALVRTLDRELGVPPLPETVALHEAIRADRLEPPPRSPTLSHPPARHARGDGAAPGAESAGLVRPRVSLVGRDAELSGLDAAWRAAAHTGTVVGVVAAPGVGRSALVSELARRAGEAGGAVVVLRAHAAERGLAFAAAADLVRALVEARPEARSAPATSALGVLAPDDPLTPGPPLEGPGDLLRLHEAVREALAGLSGGTVPALLVVDDAHLLDGPSAALLAYLVRRLPRGVLLVATWADGEGSTPLPTAVREVAGAAVGLGPLDRDGVAALLAGDGRAPADVDDVLRRTGGVPLLVREHATAHDGGADVRQRVADRLAAAPSTTQQLVGAAAVVGTVADPELLRAACGRDELETVEAIEDAVLRGLLVERADREGYDLPHDVVRDVALGRLGLARRRLLHSRVADVLARRHGLDPLRAPAGAVAAHLAAAGREAEAQGWYVTAAGESSRLCAYVEALEQLRAALALGADPGPVHEASAAALVRLGRYGEALVALEQAAALSEPDRDRLARVEHAIAQVHDRLGDHDLAETHLEAARELLGPRSPGRAGVDADLALVLHRLGRDTEADTLADEAARLAADVRDPGALARAGNVRGLLAAAGGDPETAEESFAQVVRLARERHDVDLLVAGLNNLARVRLRAGRPDAALDPAREALTLAERQGDRHRVATLHSHVADVLHALGREEDARAEMTSSARAFAAVDEAGARPAVWTLAEW